MKYTINQDKKISPKLWMLALISLYSIWQIGVMFFSGTSLSLYGKTPIDISSTYTVIFIVVGYISTICLNYFFFEKSILFAKIALFLSLIVTILMFVPVNSVYLTILFYANAFLCTFLIGSNYAVETNLLDNKSELKFVFICSLIGFSSIVIMQGDFLHIPFVIFNIVSLLILLTLFIVYCWLPSQIETYNKTDKEHKKIPILLKVGMYLAVFISTLCLVFGTTISETVKYGVGIFYAIGIICTLFFAFLILKKKISPFMIYTFSFAASVIGFVFAILSMQYSWCIYPAIILIGTSCLPANMIGFLSNSLFESKPSKIYAAVLVFIGLIVATLHTVLLKLFRADLSILFSLISIVAIVMLIIYSSIESSLTYHWRKISIMENSAPKTPNKPPIEDSPFDILSEREKEIVDCILKGYNNAEIAKIMILSPQTVKSYRKNIYAKLVIHSRSELFGLAKKNDRHLVK